MNHKRSQKGSEPLKITPEHLISRGSSYYELDINYDPRTEHLKLKLLPIESDGTNEKSSKGSLVKEPEKMGNRCFEPNIPEEGKNKLKNILWNSKLVSLETKFKHTNDVRSIDEGKINNKILFTIKPKSNTKDTQIAEVSTSQIKDSKVEKIKKTRGAFTATDELTTKKNSVKKTKENSKEGKVDEILLKSCEGNLRSSKTSLKKKKHDSYSENGTIIKSTKKLEGASENDTTQGSSSKSARTNPLKKCSSDYRLQKTTGSVGSAETEVYYVLLPEQNEPIKITGNKEYSYEYVKRIIKRKSRSKNSIQDQDREFVSKSPKTREETVTTKLKSKTVILHKTLEMIEDKRNVQKKDKSKEKIKTDSIRKTHADIITKGVKNSNTNDGDSPESVHKKEKANAKKSNDKSTKRDKLANGKSTERLKRKHYNSPASFEQKDVHETLIQEITYSDYNANNLIIEENKSSFVAENLLEKKEILSDKHYIDKNSESKNVEPIYIYKAKTKPKIKEIKHEGDNGVKKTKEVKKTKDESAENKSNEPMYLFKAESRKKKKENEDGAKKDKTKSQGESELPKEHEREIRRYENDKEKELKKKQNRKRSKHLSEIIENVSSEQCENTAVKIHVEENNKKNNKQRELSQENTTKYSKEKQKKQEDQTSSERYKEPISTEDDYLKIKLLKKARAKSKDKICYEKKSKKSKHSLKSKKKKCKTRNSSTDENANAADSTAKPSKTHNLSDTRALSRLIENHHKAYLENGLKNKKQNSCPTETSLLSEKRKESQSRKEQITNSLLKSFKKMRSQKIYKMREVNKSSLDSFSSKTQDQCQKYKTPLHFCSLGLPDQNVSNRSKELRHEVSLSHLHIYPDLSQYTTPSRMLDINKPVLKSPARSQEISKRDKPRKRNSLLKSIEKKTVLSEVITKREKNNYSDQSDLISYYAKPKKKRTRSNQFTRKLVCTENVIETTLRDSDENCSAGFVVEGIEPPKRLGFIGENAKLNQDKNSKLHKTVFSVMEIESTTINSTDYNTDLSLCEISAFTKSDSSKNDTKQVVTEIFVHQIDSEKETMQIKPQVEVDVDKDDITRTLNIIKDLDSLLADIKQNLPNTPPKKQPNKASKPKTSALSKDFFDSQPQYSSDTETTYNISISQDCQTDETQKVERENRATESPKSNLIDFVTCFTQNENTNKSFKINILDTKSKSTKQTDELLENDTNLPNEESSSSRVIRICLGDCFQTNQKEYKDQNTDTIEDNENTKKNCVSKLSEHSSKGSIRRIPKRNVGLEKKLSKVLKINPLIKKRSRDTFDGIFAKCNRRHYLANECVYLLSNILYPVINDDCKRRFFQPKQKTPFTGVYHPKEPIEDNFNETNKRQIDNMFVKQKLDNKEIEEKSPENKSPPKSTSAIKLEPKVQKRYQNIFECSPSKIVDSQLSFQKPKSKGSSLMLTKDYKDTARMRAYQKRKLYGEELRKTNKTNLDWNIRLSPSDSETKTKNETVIKFGISQNGTIKKLDEEESRDYKKISDPWNYEKTFSTVTLSSKNTKNDIPEDTKRGFTLHSKIEGSSLNIYISNKSEKFENTNSSSSAFLPCQLYVESASKLAENYEALKNLKRKLKEFDDEKPKKMARKPRLLYSFSDDLAEQISSHEKPRENRAEGKLSRTSLSEDSLEKTDNQNVMDFKKGHNFLVYKSLVDMTNPMNINNDPLNDLFQNETDLNYGKEQIITPISDESGYESCKSKKSPSVKNLFKKPSVVFDIFKSKSKNSGSNLECKTSKVEVSESETTMSRSVSRNPSITIFKRKSISFLPWKNFKRPKSVDGSTRVAKINIVRRTLSYFLFKKSKLSKNEMPVIISGSRSSNKILKSERCENVVENWRTSTECDLRKSISTQTMKSEAVENVIRDTTESTQQNTHNTGTKSKTVDFVKDTTFHGESPRDSDDEHNKSKNCCPCANIFQKPCFSSKTKTLPDLERIMKDPQKSKLFLKNLEFYQKNRNQCHEYARKISIEKHFKKYNMSKQSNFKEIPLNILLGKNEKSKIEKSNFAQGDTVHKLHQNSNELFFENSNINFLLKKTPLPQTVNCDKVTPPEFFSENVKQVFFCNASYITFPVHEIIIDANKKKQLNNNEASNADCHKMCECPCFSDDPQNDSDTSSEENCGTSSKSSQNKLLANESKCEETVPPKQGCEECESKIDSNSTQKCVEEIFVASQKDYDQNEKVDDPNTSHDNETSNNDDELFRDEEEIAEEFMGQVSLMKSSESNLHKSPSKQEALKKLQEIRISMTDQELFNRLLISFENQDKIADQLFNDEDFFATQLISVKSKKSVEKFFEHQKNQLPIKTSTKETVLFSKSKSKAKQFSGEKPGDTTSNERLLASISVPKLEHATSDNKNKNLVSSVPLREFSETTVNPAEIGMCFRRGFRPDNMALSGESYETDDNIDASPSEEAPTRKTSYINFSERQTPLEYLLALGFSVDEATNAIKNVDVTNRLCAAIREARIWINRISTTQGTLLYLVSFKTNKQIMRYFLQLVEAIINGRINNAVKLDSFIRLLINIENGDVDMIKVFGIGRVFAFEDEINEDQIVKKQMKKVFTDVYTIAHEEAAKHGKTLSNESIELLRIVSAKYRAGLVPHLELIARYVGQNLIVNEVQLQAAMIYLSRLNTTNVKLKEFERYCDIRCQND